MVMTLEADYAVRIVEYLTKHPERCDAKTISERVSVPLRFSLKILRDLVREGMVCSFKGAKGGYTLAKPPADHPAGGGGIRGGAVYAQPLSKGGIQLRPGPLQAAQHLREDLRGRAEGIGFLQF